MTELRARGPGDTSNVGRRTSVMSSKLNSKMGEEELNEINKRLSDLELEQQKIRADSQKAFANV